MYRVFWLPIVQQRWTLNFCNVRLLRLNMRQHIWVRWWILFQRFMEPIKKCILESAHLPKLSQKCLCCLVRVLRWVTTTLSVRYTAYGVAQNKLQRFIFIWRHVLELQIRLQMKFLWAIFFLGGGGYVSSRQQRQSSRPLVLYNIPSNFFMRHQV